MLKRCLLVIYRLAFAMIGSAALASQYVHILTNPLASKANFFFYFTVESNLLACVVLVISALALAKGSKVRGLSMLRGAATLYMVTTGVIYVLLLSGLEESLQTAIPWINFVLHYLMPVVLLVDWCIDRPAKGIAFKRGLVWLVFPLVYGVVSVVRGHFGGWYPYPFLNPNLHGYSGLAVTSVCIAVAITALIALVTWISRLGPVAAHKK